MELIASSSLVVHLKLKCLLKEPTQDDIIEAKEFYLQLFLKDIKGSLCDVTRIRQYIIKHV